MARKKLKVEVVIDANKKTCGYCRHRQYGYCHLFESIVVLARNSNYERLSQCIDAEANNHG